MKQIRSWMSHHPFKVVLFTFLFTLIPAIMAVTNESMFYPGLAAFMFFVIVWAIGIWRYSKNIVTVLLLVGFCCNPAHGTEPQQTPAKEESVAAVGVGVVIVCVGAFCVYKIVKVCQKKFPPKDSGYETNKTDSFMATAEDEYGAAYEYSSIGSCYQPPGAFLSLQEQPASSTTFSLSFMMTGGHPVVAMKAEDSEATAQTWNEFQSEMAGHGLFLTGRSTYQPQFSLNGIPCDAAEVPIEFDPLTARVIHNTAGNLKRITVERSVNLVNWAPLLVTDISFGTGFKVVDTTREGQMFYRVQVSQP